MAMIFRHRPTKNRSFTPHPAYNRPGDEPTGKLGFVPPEQYTGPNPYLYSIEWLVKYYIDRRDPDRKALFDITAAIVDLTTAYDQCNTLSCTTTSANLYHHNPSHSHPASIAEAWHSLYKSLPPDERRKVREQWQSFLAGRPDRARAEPGEVDKLRWAAYAETACQVINELSARLLVFFENRKESRERRRGAREQLEGQFTWWLERELGGDKGVFGGRERDEEGLFVRQGGD